MIEKKYILALGELSTQELDDIAITTEAKYSINQKMLCLYMNCNGSNSYLHVNSLKICHFKPKGS